MNVTPYHSPDSVLTEALVYESVTRAANLRSATVRNVLFGAAALTGAALIGWAALTWADAQRLDPALLAKALATLPPLKVEPVKLDPDSATVKLADGSEVAIAEDSKVEVDGAVQLDPNATVRLDASSLKTLTLPRTDTQPTKTSDGDAIKREVTVFSTVAHGVGSVITGWTYPSGSATRPTSQYCYYRVETGGGHATITNIANDRVPDINSTSEMLAKCQWWQGG